MADERSPNRDDVTDLEAAAERVLAKARAADPAIEGVRAKTREAAGELRTAATKTGSVDREVQDLERERQRLEQQRRKVAKRLSSAELRLEGSELQTPANAARTRATYQRHAAELARIDKRLDAIGSAPASRARAVADPRAYLDRLNARAAEVEKSLAVHASGMGSRWQVENRADLAGYQTRAMREGAKRPSAFTTRARAEAELAVIARERAKRQLDDEARAARRAALPSDANQYQSPIGPRHPALARRDEISGFASQARAAEASEQAKTTAVEAGTRKRVRARQDERKAVGDLAELERTAQANVGRFAAALDPQQRAEFDKRREPTPEAERPAATRRAKQVVKEVAQAPPPPPPPRKPPAPPSEPPAEPPDRRPLYQRLSNALQQRVRDQEALAQSAEQERFEARVIKQKARNEEDRRVRAEARRREAAERAAAEEERDARVTGLRTAGANQYAQPIGPSNAERRRIIGAGQYDAPIGPRQVGAGQYPTSIGPTITAAQRARILGAGQFPEGTGPQTFGMAARDAGAGQFPRGTQPNRRTNESGLVREQRRSAQAIAQTTEAEVEQQALRERATTWEKQYATALGGSERALNRVTAAAGYSTQAMRRHGTFTTEFISAAAKGEVAYREWGWQIGAAAAKFGAWTVAGAGVYAAINAVSKIGEGAVQSASGVDSLKRTLGTVNSGQAQQSFRSQAAHFNVPIQTVVDAQTRMGAVFHNQADAATAATAALYALQTGQVSVEQSTKDLISIQQGFGANAQDLVTLFDQLNYVQNNYGARIPDIETGIAGASGAFSQLGTSMSEAVAYFTVLQRFGTSGAVASTIFRRLPNEISKPGNQAVLAANGIDYKSRNLPQMIRQASAAVAGGADAQTIAKALVGGQFASRFTQLLVHPRLLDEVLNNVKTKSAGASEAELGHVLHQFDQQLKAVGIELSNLGSNLSQSGLVTVLGTGVVALREMLSLANTLLGIFNQLPAPLKTVASFAAVGGAALAGARRLSLGGALEGRFGGLGDRAAPYLLETNARRGRRLSRKGVNDAIKEATDENERATGEAVRAAHAEHYAISDVPRVQARSQQLLEAGEIDEAGALARDTRAMERATKATDAREAAELRMAIAADRLTAQTQIKQDITSAGNAAVAGQTRGRRRLREGAELQAAAEHGLLVPEALGANIPSGPKLRQLAVDQQGNVAFAAEDSAAQAVRQRGTSVGPPGAGAAIGAERAAIAAAGAVRPEESRRFSTKLRELGARIGQQTGALRETAATQGRMAALTQAAGGAASGASVAARAAGGGLRTAVTRIAGFLGPEGLILAGLLSLPEVFTAVKTRADSLEQANRAPKTPPTSVTEVQALRRKAQDRQRKADTLTGRLTRYAVDPLVLLYEGAKGIADSANKAIDSIGHELDKLTGAADAATKKGGGFGAAIRRTIGQVVPPIAAGVGISNAVEARTRANENANVRRAAARVRIIAGYHRQGQAAPGLSGDEIGNYAKQDIAELQAGKIDLTEFNKRRDIHLAELGKALENGKPLSASRRKYIEDRIRQLMTQGDVEAAAMASVESRYNLLLSRTADPVEQARLKLQQAAEQLKVARGFTDQNKINDALADYNNAQRAVVDALKDQAEQQLDALGAIVSAGLGGAGALNSYVSQLRAAIAKLRGSNKPEDQQRLATLTGQLRSTQEAAGRQTLQDALANARTPADIRRAYARYRRAGRAATAGTSTEQTTTSIDPADAAGVIRGGDFHQTTVQSKPRLSSAERAIRRQREQEIFEAYRARREAQTAFTAGNLGGGVEAAKYQLQQASDLVKRGMRVYAKGSVELLGLMSAQQSAQQALAQAQLAQLQAQGAYDASKTTDPVAQGQINISNLQQQLALQRRTDPNNKTAILQTLTQINQARQQQAETIRQRASDLADANYALRESLNDDPVYQARLEAQRTAAVVRRGGFTNPADKIRAQADANTARRAAQDAAVQARMEDVQFDVDIGKITTQQQIRQYEELLKTSKMGQQQKKRLKQEIARLKHDADTADAGSFELGLGNIKIPTMYEVARLIKGGASNVTHGVTNANTVNVTVNGAQDYDELGRVLEKHVSGAGKATARAAQMR